MTLFFLEDMTMNDDVWKRVERNDCRFNFVIAGSLVITLLWLFVVVVVSVSSTI
jgi:hypothetical protein